MMKRFKILCITFSFLISLSYQLLAAPFLNIATDKWAHFLGGVALTEYGQNRGFREGEIVIGVASIGLLKEGYDHFFVKDSAFDWADFYADMLGVGLALLIN